ncbi:hypothetical protein V5799_006244 [Amblyomma americanum]|uniref:Uncharacterized protein n=1 Tax=Amblyomma americanum TaxID=6943 RepID=A0AAQ4DWY6_AMBAM
MGGRSLKVFPVALSILASFMSAITLLGTASEMYVAGTQYVVMCVSYCFVIPAAAYFYMPVFHHLQLTSAYEANVLTCDEHDMSFHGQLLPLYVMDVLGGYKGLPGLFVSGIFSGALSYSDKKGTRNSARLKMQGAAIGILTSLTVTMCIGIGAFYFKPATRKARFSVMGCLQEYINVTNQHPGNVTFPAILDPDVAK